MIRAIPRPLLLACLALLLAACDSQDGRDLPPPAAHQTTTSVTTPAIGTPDDGGLVEVFSLTSPAFADGAALPAEHTCDGSGISPPLQWASTPPAAELALVVRDVESDGFVHWVLTGIDPTVSGFAAGGVPEAALPGPNDAGGRGWAAPCPAPDEVHRYQFTLHAVPEPLVIPLDITAQEAAQAIEAASSGQAVLTAVQGG